MNNKTNSTQLITSLELGRVIAMFAIVVLHSHIFHQTPLFNEVPWLGYILNQAARFAVPFFFIVSGYLIQPKLSTEPLTTIANYSKPLIKIWLVWSAICLLLPINLYTVVTEGYLAERTGYINTLLEAPLNSLLEGGLVHLWFIPGLICAVSIVGICVHTGRQSWLSLIAIALYLYGLSGGSYGTLTETWTPFFTRNGPFFGTIMVWVGFEIRRQNWRPSMMTAMLISLVGMAMHFAEAFYLAGHDVAFNKHDFLFGTLPWGVGVFMIFLLNPHWGNKKWVLKLANKTLAIYVAHMSFLILMFNVAGFTGLQGYARDAVLLFGTLLATLGFVWLIYRTPLKKILFR